MMVDPIAPGGLPIQPPARFDRPERQAFGPGSNHLLAAGIGSWLALVMALLGSHAAQSQARHRFAAEPNASMASARDRTAPLRRPSCVVIDNDHDIDDMMAIPLVLGHQPVAAIVQTEGYSLPGPAAAALAALIQPAGAGANPIPILVGASQSPGPDLSRWPWLPFFRDMMTRSNGLLSAAPRPRPADPAFAQHLLRAVAGCRRISLLITGPFSSFIRYGPLIRDRLDQVVVSGKPLGDRSRSPGQESFNCGYDLAACRQAMTQLQGIKTAYVVVPNFSDCRPSVRPPAHCYTPDVEMVLGRTGPDGQRRGGLVDAGLPGRLRQALVNATPCSLKRTDPARADAPCSSLSTWEPAAAYRGPDNLVLFWDMATALRLLHPELFSAYVPDADPAAGGRHLEPTLVRGSHQRTVEELRSRWTRATNRALLFGLGGSSLSYSPAP